MAITLLATERSKVQATVVSKMLEQVGFTVQVQLVNHAAWFRQTNDLWFGHPQRHHLNLPWPGWDIALSSLEGRFPRVVLKASLFRYRTHALFGPWTWIRVQPELHRLHTEAMRTSDLAQQQAVIAQMERHTRDQAYFLFLYSPIQLYAVHKAVNFRPHAGPLSLVDISVTDAHWSVRQEKTAGSKETQREKGS